MITNGKVNGYVILDSTWGRRLGVRRSGGLYRITRRELRERLEQLQQVSVDRVLSPSAVRGGRGLTAEEPPVNLIATQEAQSHFVEFYETEAFLVDSVRDFHASGLIAGDAAIVVATGAHRNAFERALLEAGIDLSAAQQCGRFIVLDASETLAKLMVDGMPDAARFKFVIGQLISRAAENAHGVRIYGEMVAVLWDEGNVAAAIALEDLWNDLATEYPFSLFCAYPMRAFDADTSSERFRRVCGQHSKVLLQSQGS
jgi:hypothetical protein